MVVLFNWAFGAIVLLALMQLVLDVGLLFGILVHGGVSAPDGVRYGLAALAAVAAAIGVHQAMRIPPLKISKSASADFRASSTATSYCN